MLSDLFCAKGLFPDRHFTTTSAHVPHLHLSLSQEAARRREEDDRRARERTEEEEARCLERFLEAEPLDSTELHAFTDSMLPGCFHLLDELPDTVYRLCDLLMTAIKRSGPEYRDLILRQVVNQVSNMVCV